MKIKIKLDTKKTKQTDDFVLQGLPGVITIIPLHNHSLNTAETLRFLPPTDCKEKFIEYFNDGMGIAESAKYHREMLQMEDNFQVDLANSRINPTDRAIRYWYDQWRLFHLGPRSGPHMIEKLKEKMLVYEKQGIAVRFNNEPFAVSITTPLMKRASQLASAAEIVFVDSTSSCDAENHTITFFLTPCAEGAVPLGIVITKGQTEKAYTASFGLLKNSLENPFNRNGIQTVFMTDNSSAEINALQATWPGSINFLCIFHMGQAVWRWLWDSKHGVPKEQRSTLMGFFQRVLYAPYPEEAYQEYLNAHAYIGTLLPIYDNWNEYLEQLWVYKEKWCLAFRDERIKGHHTNNFSEVCIQIFKDNVLSRVKAYNVITLLDFCATVLEKYYCNKLMEYANSRHSGPRLYLLSLKKKAAYLKKESIQKINDYVYFVDSEEGNTDVYIVNMRSGCCSCFEGMHGKLCKHQYGVYHFCNAISKNFPAFTPADKHQIAYLALGEKAPPQSFYQPFLLENTTEQPVRMDCSSMPVSNECGNSFIPSSESASQNLHENDDNMFKKLIGKAESLHNKFGSSSSGLAKLLNRLGKIQTQGQWEEFLHTAGNKIPLRRSGAAAIHVQPTSIARRSLKVTRGAKRLPSGRPAKGTVVKAKRKHSLVLNVSMNQPNAKMHGYNH